MAELQGRAAWLLDEVAYAGRENLDAEHVARYDQIEDAQADAEVRLFQELGLDAACTVLDLGAGTGQFSLAVAPVSGRVVAVDISPAMLDRLRAEVAERGLSNVDCVGAGLLSYEHRGDPVDFAYSRYALHHLRDFWKAVALARVHGLLRPGGVLRLWDVVYGFDPGDAAPRIEAWCASVGTSGAAGWTRADLEEHVRDEHSTFTWLLEPMILRAGFVIDDAWYADDLMSARYVLRKTERPL